ncbi:hypothetical protein YC2023_022665 [Brassica napus]
MLSVDNTNLTSFLSSLSHHTTRSPVSSFYEKFPDYPKSRALAIFFLLWFLIVGNEMGFIMEFAENLVLRLMEDPEVRDRKAREHIYEMHERCKKIKEMWALPIRPYGFWTFERHNAQLRWDPQISQVAGRRDPYDDLLKDHPSSSN